MPPALTDSEASARIDELALEYFRWRSGSAQPVSADDVPRCQRPADWVPPDYSAAALNHVRHAYCRFRARLSEILRRSSPAEWEKALQVDAALLSAHFERLRWCGCCGCFCCCCLSACLPA